MHWHYTHAIRWLDSGWVWAWVGGVGMGGCVWVWTDMWVGMDRCGWVEWPRGQILPTHPSVKPCISPRAAVRLTLTLSLVAAHLARCDLADSRKKESGSRPNKSIWLTAERTSSRCDPSHGRSSGNALTGWQPDTRDERNCGGWLDVHSPPSSMFCNDCHCFRPWLRFFLRHALRLGCVC